MFFRQAMFIFLILQRVDNLRDQGRLLAFLACVYELTSNSRKRTFFFVVPRFIISKCFFQSVMHPHQILLNFDKVLLQTLSIVFEFVKIVNIYKT